MPHQCNIFIYKTKPRRKPLNRQFWVFNIILCYIYAYMRHYSNTDYCHTGKAEDVAEHRWR